MKFSFYYADGSLKIRDFPTKLEAQSAFREEVSRNAACLAFGPTHVDELRAAVFDEMLSALERLVDNAYSGDSVGIPEARLAIQHAREIL